MKIQTRSFLIFVLAYVLAPEAGVANHVIQTLVLTQTPCLKIIGVKKARPRPKQRKKKQERRREMLAKSQELGRIQESHTYTHDRDLDNLANSLASLGDNALANQIRGIKKIEGTRGSGSRVRALERLLKSYNLYHLQQLINLI